MAYDGEIGDPDYEIPDWYLLIRAAKYLRVAPWELEAQSEQWFTLALEAQVVDALAEEARRKRLKSSS